MSSASSFRVVLIALLLLLGATIARQDPPDLIAMLKFVSTLGCTDPSWTAATPVCDWAGVECSDTNVTGVFDWNGQDCPGTVDLTVLPPTMQSVSLNSNGLHGPLNFSALPSGLQHLDLSYNGFWGPLDLTNLPRGMSYLNLGYCSFNSTVNLSALPSWLYSNGFLMLNNNAGICGNSSTNFQCPDGSGSSSGDSFLTLPYQCKCTGQEVSCGACPQRNAHADNQKQQQKTNNV